MTSRVLDFNGWRLAGSHRDGLDFESKRPFRRRTQFQYQVSIFSKASTGYPVSAALRLRPALRDQGRKWATISPTIHFGGTTHSMDRRFPGFASAHERRFLTAPRLRIVSVPTRIVRECRNVPECALRARLSAYCSPQRFGGRVRDPKTRPVPQRAKYSRRSSWTVAGLWKWQSCSALPTTFPSGLITASSSGGPFTKDSRKSLRVAKSLGGKE